MLIAKYSHEQIDINQALSETKRLFHQHYTQRTSAAGRNSFFHKIFHSILATSINDRTMPFDTLTNEKGKVYPVWINRLTNEYTQLFKQIKREVNIQDYGAAGDGKTDDTKAFKQAIGNGKVKVIVPEGVYLTKGIRLPSWTALAGDGKGRTIIKLHDASPKETRLITNANHWRGNHHILVCNMSLDWNVERLGNERKTSAGGNHSSCLTFANVTYGWAKDLEAINPGLHCFDVSSAYYNYSGDGYRARKGSKYVWIDHVTGSGFGDDGITTHHSEHIFISNSFMCDPSGRAHEKGFSNSNGIEIDDGSEHVWLVNNATARCFGGVECKAHHNSSAAANVLICGHLSVNDTRSYNFRHIGHHKRVDPESKTADHLLATNLVAIAPIRNNHLYDGPSPRGLVVSAYKNVVVNHFTLIGDPDYDYKGEPIAAIQYRARNVTLNNLSFQHFQTAGCDIQVFGGEQKADDVYISHVSLRRSSPKGIQVGRGVNNAVITDVNVEKGEEKSH
jgi:hypothetical protein